MIVVAMLVIAALAPGGAIAWVVVGAIAGSLAGRVMRGEGFGCFKNTLVGIAGAVLGGVLTAILFPNVTFAFWGSLLIAFLGACILIALVRLAQRILAARSQGKR